MRVMLDVPLLSQELVDRGNGAHTHLTFLDAGDTHMEILGNIDDGVELGRTRWR